MNPIQVPDVVVLRLPLYVRTLTQFGSEGVNVVSSQQLGSRLQMTPAQIRKDLSYFGRFGKQGKGYNVQSLMKKIGQILGLDRKWRTCLVGMGRLGQAVVNYPGFVPEGFEIVAAFDSDPLVVGTTIGGVTVHNTAMLSETIENRDISIAIVAVPSSQAQPVVDKLIDSGVRGILNYAPVALHVPTGTVVRNIDPVLSLQSMTFHLMGSGLR